MPGNSIFPRLRRAVFAALVFGGALAAAFGAAAAPRAAVFDFEFIDTSTEGAMNGQRPDEQRRIALMGETLRAAIKEKGVYEVVDIAPAADTIKKSPRFSGCNGCAEDIAKTLNADLAIVGYVQKVSNLILNVNVEIRDVKAGKALKVLSVDIRSNTDDSWLRGLNWIIKNRLYQ